MRFSRDDATRWVWIVFGLVQATLTMLMAFDVLDNLEVPQAVTAITLVVYVGVNELWVKPKRGNGADEPDPWVATAPDADLAADPPPPPHAEPVRPPGQ